MRHRRLVALLLVTVVALPAVAGFDDDFTGATLRVDYRHIGTAEEEHIVRMGLLASGAAHELGTPLSTLSVILGDWHHLPTFASDPELSQDVSEMQAQVMRCKSIVTNILLSAGETRGEAPVETRLHDLFECHPNVNECFDFVVDIDDGIAVLDHLITRSQRTMAAPQT